ncbi:oxidoreductase [Streptomyces griseoaurantiacus M045]|uniref:Oxidoreductase n=1 Tax=Streptomyces griseoaurantiacus M045 TaxID=996637 RepID=F3NH26_9ACTN|nr:Gfo/Idh/MocA family oxidoreductase [Streptomyces griseoaurantiacus]EGG47153.1 oxidoreductase [Streptomyces griseoaurantiacus M045]
MTAAPYGRGRDGRRPWTAHGQMAAPRRTALRIGMIGLGVISRFYLAALERSPEAELVAVCDRDPAALAGLPAHLERHTDHRRLLREAEVDAVVVNVPNDAHFPVCRDALAAGRAVCVEKPLATRVADARALDRYARERGLPLFTSFHRRYNDPVRALLGRLPEGVPVDTLTVRYKETIEEHAGRDRWYLDPARCGGGCLADNGPNALDLVRLFLGGDVSVDRVALDRDRLGVDRAARMLLRAPATGARARVELDWSYPGERKTVEVRLADGRADAADMLAGHTEFKGSLWHEYAGVLRDFARVVRAHGTSGTRSGPGSRPGPASPVGSGPGPAPDGLAVAELVAACYTLAGGAPEREETHA